MNKVEITSDKLLSWILANGFGVAAARLKQVQPIMSENLLVPEIDIPRIEACRCYVIGATTLVRSFSNSNKEEKVKLNLNYNESSGTQKLFDLAGVFLPAFTKSLTGLILIDEIDSHFHPSLLLKLVNLLNNPEVNKGGTQLIFTSHDTNMLSPAIMRRDQFYFTEKGNNESSRLYSLADLKGIRNDADFAKQYLAGYYGAVPQSQFNKRTVCSDIQI